MNVYLAHGYVCLMVSVFVNEHKTDESPHRRCRKDYIYVWGVIQFCM